MYETFFGLAKRPFTSMPDPDCFVPIEGIHQAYSGLAQCAIDGRGIGVLTAPAGLGKTLICQRLARELGDRFTVVFLPTANFLTRRSLLQAILFELGHSYVRMGDQELRLALTSVIRRLRPGRGTIALIVDEAHLLAPRMLEELRALTNFADAGESLLRLVICGQLTLDDALSQPSLAAFNQRIGIQTTLQTLTRDESAEYVSRRLALAGANVTGVMTNEALRTICEASDGSPRCLNQLCDHSLLLGYLGSQKPVTHQTVLEALDDLKQLPLTWNEPAMRRSAVSDSPILASSETSRDFDNEDTWIVTPDYPIETSVSPDEHNAVEFGHDVEFGHNEATGDSIEIGEPAGTSTPASVARVLAGSATSSRMSKIESLPTASPIAEEVVDEEVVIDRYAALDSALSRLTRTMLSARAISRRHESTATVTIKHDPTPNSDDDSPSFAFDVVLPEDVANAEICTGSSTREARSETSAKSGDSRLLSSRRYERLFSELRRRRIGA
jgi:type II secretory pathway predicted ATPase ExeA